MKIEIEQYKGQTIEYDVERDKFVCDITIEDNFKSTSRKSLKDVRKEIDTFIKLNLEFKPFKILHKRSYGNNFSILNIEGIRTDGQFVCSDVNSPNRKHFLNFEKEIKNGDLFFEYDANVIQEKDNIRKEEEEHWKLIRKKEEELIKKLTPLDLKPFDKYKNAFKDGDQ